LGTLKKVSQRALSECDAVVITAGSSASARDITANAIASLGAPGVLVHGINIKPGKPTILAVCDGKSVIGLPGNPVSAMVIAGLFVVPVVNKLCGLRVARPERTCLAQLMVNIASKAGREDWVAVKLTRSDDKGDGDAWLAEPIFTKSNLIFSLVAADGLVRIPAGVTGYPAGENVKVYLL
jgi:molybdopterin molybdotransferase